jgi:dienelactone hydrolase
MADDLSRNIDDFARRDFTFDGLTKPVMCTGETGPAVIVIHEVYGFTPHLARLCRWIRDAGFRVYAPVLVGRADATNAEAVSLGRILSLCVSREFTLFASNRSSPIVDWLKPLARQLHAECGGRGVGVIGMCLTGGFALNMAVDPSVVAPVLSQPSMPPRAPAGIDASPDEIARVTARIAEEGLKVRAWRFEGDALCRQPRFDTLSELLGDGFLPVVLPDSAANPAGMKAQGRPPHSVFTGDLVDAPGEPTRAAVDELIQFYRERLRG